MANWCSNIVNFSGNAETLRQIENLFRSLAAKEALKQEGQVPDFVPSHYPHFFSIRWEDDALYYRTKWSPNLDTMVEVSKHFGVDHVHFYCEPVCLLYGEASFQNGELENTVLSAADFKAYTHSPQNDRYMFEGRAYEDVYEVWEILLERKKNKNTDITKHSL